jgi:hypothetical protein
MYFAAYVEISAFQIVIRFKHMNAQELKSPARIFSKNTAINI